MRLLYKNLYKTHCMYKIGIGEVKKKYFELQNCLQSLYVYTGNLSVERS
jgi:hypothetical protein